MKAPGGYAALCMLGIEKRLLIPSARFGADDYHRLRVDIKKLRALIRLAEAESKRYDARDILDALRPLFSAAGRVRELQLEQMALARNFDPQLISSLLRSFDSQIAECHRDFFRVLKNADPESRKALYRALLRVLGDLSEKQVKRHLRSLRVKAGRITAIAEPSIEKLHDLRKLLKRHQYILNALGVKKRTRKLNHIQELLGEWHDRVLMAERFETMTTEGTTPVEIRERLGTLCISLLAEASVLRNQINRELSLGKR